MDNNDRFRFRAFVDGCMVYEVFCSYLTSYGCSFPQFCKLEYPLMQSTGLKDKNGVLIFEGDVVRIDWKDARYDPQIGAVEWNNKQAWFDFGGGCASEVHWSHEVIGNIYEHKHLLDQ